MSVWDGDVGLAVALPFWERDALLAQAEVEMSARYEGVGGPGSDVERSGTGAWHVTVGERVITVQDEEVIAAAMSLPAELAVVRGVAAEKAAS